MGLREFTFAGTASSTYNLFITEAAPYNAPPKAVEMIEIPGRNGAYALDKGNFENVEQTYHVVVHGSDEADFREMMSDVRNWLCSKVGYCRLSDDYNPGEYRMATYKSGLETDDTFWNGAEFDVTFDCKPQRWLTSGEEAVTIGEWETETVSGEVVEVEATETDVVKSLVADIEPIQSGSGTPSPDNVRPISGHDDVTVTVADDHDNPTESETYTITLPSTTYGGTLDLVSGELTVTHKLFNVTNAMLTNASYVSGASNASSYYYNLANVIADSDRAPSTFTLDMGAWGDKLEARQGMYSDKTVEGFTVSGRYVSIRINSNRVADTSGASLASYLTSLDIVYPLATPTTYQLTPQQVDLLVGQNTVFADTGDVTLEYGQNPMVLINPTPFEAEPLLAVKGYGTIGFNGYEVEIDNGALGTIQLASGQLISTATTITLGNISSLNAGDVIYFSSDYVTTEFTVQDTKCEKQWTGGTASSASNIVSALFKRFTPRTAKIRVVADTDTRFAKGTSSTITSSVTINVNGHGTGTLLFHITITFAYDGNDTIVVTKSITASGTYAYLSDVALGYDSNTLPEVYGDSTKNFLGNPTYIDCEVGECYKYEGGEIVSLNGVISLGSDLPKLASGTNTFTYDNTITELKVTPRYWKV